MGEYFNWVNVDRREYLCPADFDLGNKSHESIHKGNPLLGALYELLSERWRGDLIVFLGDEGTIPSDTPFQVLKKLDEQALSGDYFDHICENYRNVSCLFKDAEAEVREQISNYLDDLNNGCPYVPTNEYGIDLMAPFDGLFCKSGKTFRYITNHTKKVYYSLEITKILYEGGSLCDYADPLSVLMAYGRSVDSGAWLGDVIGVSHELPNGYALLTEIYLENGGRCVVTPENEKVLHMKKVDMFWMSNDDWWELRNHIPTVKDDAPQEAQESYARYLKQTTEDSARKIDCDWQEEFTSLILVRGKKYFEEGNVRRIQRSGNVYIAQVVGTEDYEIEISVDEEGIEEMLCTCPYARDNNCKHMAAVLFALESEDVCVEDLPPAKQPTIVPHVPMELPWLEAIDHLPEDVVRKELLKRADRDDRLKERLSVLYLGNLPEHQLQNWKASLQETAGEYADRRGRINDEDTWEFLNELGNFMDAKLPLLLEVGAVMDAFHMVWIVMETALEWELQDLDDGVFNLFLDCEEALQELWNTATATQQEQMMQWYQEHRNEEWPGDVRNMDRVFRSLTQPDTPVTEKRVIKYIDCVPYFLRKGEWMPFPKRNHLYYDFVEKTSAYKEAMPIIEEIIKENLGEMYGCFGSCHTIWHQQKQLLLEKYGIEWFTPAELNRHACFD